MSWIIAIVMRLAGLAGVSLSPFAAGALFAGALAVVAGGAAIAGGAHLYNAGFSSGKTLSSRNSRPASTLSEPAQSRASFATRPDASSSSRDRRNK